MKWWKDLYETQNGLRMTARPEALMRRKRGVFISDKGIYVAFNGRLRLAFIFRKSVEMKADVPFEQEFQRIMQYVIDRELEPALLMAMRTRFNK